MDVCKEHFEREMQITELFLDRGDKLQRLALQFRNVVTYEYEPG